MTPTRPGPFCDVFLHAWEMGLLSTKLEAHLEECSWCASRVRDEEIPVGELFDLDLLPKTARHILLERSRQSLEIDLADSFVRLVHERQDKERMRRESRRRFMWRTAAGIVGALGLAGGGLVALDAWLNDDDIVSAVAESYFTTLDNTHASGGDAAIQALLGTQGEQDVIHTLNWITDRQVTSLYGDLVSHLGDPREPVRMRALRSLDLTPAIDLQPHLPALRIHLTDAPNQVVKTLLDRLIVKIERA